MLYACQVAYIYYSVSAYNHTIEFGLFLFLDQMGAYNREVLIFMGCF